MKLHLKFLFLVLFIYTVILISVPLIVWTVTLIPYLVILTDALELAFFPFALTIVIWASFALSSNFS